MIVDFCTLQTEYIDRKVWSGAHVTAAGKPVSGVCW